MGDTKGRSVEIRGFKSKIFRENGVNLPTNYCLQNQIATGLEAYYEVESVESFIEKSRSLAEPPRNLFLNYVLVDNDNGTEVFTQNGQRAKVFLGAIE